MEQRKAPWKSRKWWAMVIGVGVTLLHHFTGIELDPEHVLAILLPILAYILGEAVIDAVAARKGG